MSLWAIVPVKPLRRAKSRLRAALSDADRVALSRQMLERGLDALLALPEVRRTLVVSRDPEVLALARLHGAHTLSERPPIELNKALGLATRAAIGGGASGVLILPSDLPLVTPEDLAAVVGLLEGPPAVVLAPDRRKEGTNAILVAPAGLIEYEFGPSSFDRHRSAALAAGARVAVCDRPGLALDLDLPEDLGIYRQASGGRAA
jgi:2-phospho-L-lactate guanylyltransferase